MGGYFIWGATTFFQAELIHQEQMAYGDKELSMLARSKSFIIWIPMVVFLIVAIGVNIHLFGAIFSRQTPNKNKQP
jgi:hypothetical protein